MKSERASLSLSFLTNCMPAPARHETAYREYLDTMQPPIALAFLITLTAGLPGHPQVYIPMSKYSWGKAVLQPDGDNYM